MFVLVAVYGVCKLQNFRNASTLVDKYTHAAHTHTYIHAKEQSSSHHVLYSLFTSNFPTIKHQSHPVSLFTETRCQVVTILSPSTRHGGRHTSFNRIEFFIIKL